MGCSLATSLVDLIKKIKRTHNPEFLFIEPSEMVVTQELRDVAAMGNRDVRYQIGPLITLVDAQRFPFMWAERQQLMIGQIKGADIVVLSRIDRIEDPRRAYAKSCVLTAAELVRSISMIPTAWKRYGCGCLNLQRPDYFICH